MRILIVPFASGVGLGPLTHCLAIAFEARKRGHKVLFLCRQSFSKLVKKFDYEYLLAPSAKPSSIKLPPFRLAEVAVELGLTDKSYIELSVNVEREAIKLFQPDIIFTETQLTIPISAGAEKIPFATFTTWADHPDFISPLFSEKDKVRGYTEGYNKLFDKYNLPRIRDICELGFLRADLKLAATIPLLQPELKTIPDVKFVGSLLSPELEEGKLPKEINAWDKKRPVIYVYMSPGDIPARDWVNIIVKTFTKSEFNVMVTLSPLTLSPRSLPKVSNIKFYKQLPGRAATEKADLVITHGGSNTVTNAFMSGKPMMIFSHFYAERDYNGRAVERLGAGMNFRTEDFNPKALLFYTQKIISDRKYALNAKRVGKAFKKYGGAKKAVDLLEKLAKKRS